MPKQKSAISTIGILHSGTDNGKHDKEIAAFINSLKKAGYSKPKNLKIIGPLWSNDDPGTLAQNAKTLADTVPELNLIIAAGGTASTYAAQAATKNNGIPVVFTSFSQLTSPASNMTGVDARTSELDVIRLARLYDLVHAQWPDQITFGVIENPTRKDHDPKKLDDAAARLGIKLDRKAVSPGADQAKITTAIDQAFQSWQQNGIKAALVTADPLFNDLRQYIIAAEKNNDIAAIHQWHEFKDEGGFASYGTSLTEAYEKAAVIAGLVLDGTDSISNIPVVPLTTIGLAVNQKTAQRLGLKIPAAATKRTGSRRHK
jgi:ABC-type uncharacterized transport system substrate-binding protein